MKNELHGLMLHKKRPKQCPDAFCDEPLLEILIEVVNPKRDATESSSHKTKNYVRKSLPRTHRRRS